MCTLTWRRDPSSGLEIYFNRDELKTRPVADPPTLREMGDSLFLSPRDPKGTGTWMLANEHGVVICLLNRWELEGREIDSPRSRGRLVWSLGSATSVEEVAGRLSGLEDYQAFTLVAFTPSGDCCWEWDGVKLTASEVPPFLTSSSFRFEEVRDARASCFGEGKVGADLHDSPDEESSAYTVRMNRPDAQTWSRSRVRVKDQVSWEYLAEQPDLAGDAVKTMTELDLR